MPLFEFRTATELTDTTPVVAGFNYLTIEELSLIPNTSLELAQQQSEVVTKDLFSGIHVGLPVVGGAANRVLFENASGNLATNAGFTFDGTTLVAPNFSSSGLSGTNTGDATYSGENYLTLAGQALTGHKIALSNQADVASGTVFYRKTAGAGAPEVQTLATLATDLGVSTVSLAGENYLSIAAQIITANAVNLTGSNITGALKAASFPAMTGDVTNTAGSLATTIGAGKVTFAMLATGVWSDDTTLAASSSVLLPTQHAVKVYVDNTVSGLSFKQLCIAASTANVLVSNPGTAVFDGITLSSGQRLLLKDQTAGAENGAYIFNGSSSALTRTTDADTGAELVAATFPITSGTLNANKWFTVQQTSITLGTTAITFTQTNSGTSYVNGAGLDLTGNSFSISTGGVTNAMLAGSIAYSKLNLTGAIVNADLAGSIAYSKLVLTGTILNADLAGSIAYSKLVLTNSLVTADYIDASVTLAKQANVATATVFYRKTAGTGVPEVQTLVTLKTDLGLTGTNTGDQTITLSGDISGTGTTGITTVIGAGKVTNAMLAGSIAYSKLNLTSAILNTDLAGSIAYSKLSLTGAILNTDLAGSIAYSKLSLTGAILNADLAGSITYSKLSLTGSITNADLAGSIAYGKLNLTGSITNADLAGSIAYSKLNLTGAILNADLAGSIAYSKLSLGNSLVTGDYTAGSVTLAKIQNASANSKLLGSGVSGSGNPYAEIALGTGLSFSGTTLNVAVSGISVGNAVSGGGASRVLYEDASQNLAASSNMLFDGSRLAINGSTTNSTFNVLTFEVESRALGDSIISDNLYFDGSAWRARATGVGSLIRFLNGGITINTAASATGGSIPTLVDSFRADVTGAIGMGTTSPSAQLHVIKTTEQLRLGYDTSNYFKTTVGSAGSVTFDLNGTSPTFNFGKAITSPTFITPILGQPQSGNLANCTALPFPSGVTLTNQNANVGLFGPVSGGAGAVTYRTAVIADIPSLTSLYVGLSNTTWAAIGQDIYLDAQANLAAGVAAAAGKRLIVTTQYSVTSSASTAGCTIVFQGSGSFTVATGQTLTIPAMEMPSTRQIFFGLGNCILGKNACPYIHASWWAGIAGSGSNDNHAFDQITTTLTNNGGGIVEVGLGVWKVFNWAPPQGTVIRGAGQGINASNATVLVLSDLSTAGAVINLSQSAFYGIKIENLTISTSTATASSCLIATGVAPNTSFVLECNNVTFHGTGAGGSVSTGTPQVYIKDGGSAWELNAASFMHCSWQTPVNGRSFFSDTPNTSVYITNPFVQLNTGASFLKASQIGNVKVTSPTINGVGSPAPTASADRSIMASLSGTALTCAYGLLSVSDIGRQIVIGAVTTYIIALTATGATTLNSGSVGSTSCTIYRAVSSTSRAKAAFWFTAARGNIEIDNSRDEGLANFLIVDGGGVSGQPYNPIKITNSIIQSFIDLNVSATIYTSGNDYFSNTYSDAAGVTARIISNGDHIAQGSLAGLSTLSPRVSGINLTTPQLWRNHDGASVFVTELNSFEGASGFQTMNMPLQIKHGVEFASNPESTIGVLRIGSCATSGSTKPQIEWGECDQYTGLFTNTYWVYRDHSDGFCYFKGSQTGFIGYVFDGGLKLPSMADSAAANDSWYFSTTLSKAAYKDSGGTSHALY